MIVSRWPWPIASAILLAISSRLPAQIASNNPHVGYVVPAGGCRGTTLQVVVGGQNTKEVTEAFISGEGIQTEIVRWRQPLTPGEYNALNMRISDKQQELEKISGQGTVTREMAVKAAGITEEELKEMAIFVERQADPKRQPNPQITEEVTVRIRLAADAPFGDREVRLLTATGMSNPLWFYVGQWPETRENEPNDSAPHPSVHLDLPMVVNGQIMPGDVDRFLFEAKKGTKLVAHCAARALIPYLADAVPGWFQPVLHVYDDQANEVAFADSLGFRHDPVLYYEVPKDGKYVIEVHDSLYRGREDFVYRISIGEIPYVTGLFPLGGRVGRPCTVEVLGWNLPVSSLRMETSSSRGEMILPVVLERDNIFSNRVGFVVDTLREVAEREPNDTPHTAQGVDLSVIMNGRIDRPDDVDFVKFDGMGVIVAEVYARRLYSPLDSVIRLTDGHGKVLAYNDDYEDKSWPLITHHADSRLLTTTKGAHYISISDAQRRGGRDFAYRLCLRPPRPDFELRVTPSSVTAQAGTCVPITVHAIRKDGFDEDIALELENPPQGFGLGGAWVPGGQTKVRLTLIVPPEPAKEPFVLQLYGHTTVRRQRVYRPALPAEVMTQAFAYQHIVPTQNWTVFVTGTPAGKLPCTFADSGLQLSTGENGQARFVVDEGQNASQFRFELSEPPSGITLQDPVPVDVGRGLVVPVKCDPETVKPGLKGNLLFVLSREHTYVNEADKKPTTSRNVIGMLPAVPFEVLPVKRSRSSNR